RAPDRHRIVNPQPDAEAIEARAEIRSARGNADRDLFHDSMLANLVSFPPLGQRMKKGEWIDRALLSAFEADGTNAHRLCTIDNGWVERFDRDVLISFKADAARDHLVNELKSWASGVHFETARV